MIGIVTTLTNEKYWHFTLLKTFITWYVMHSLFLPIMNVAHGNLRFFLINFENLTHVTIIWLLYLSFYEVNKKPKIETN